VARTGRRPATEQWDLFALDVTAAAELLHIAITPLDLDEPIGHDDGIRAAIVQLVAALADHLSQPDPAPDATLTSRLEREATAVQLRQALDAVVV
jgi:hypothetical protein